MAEYGFAITEHDLEQPWLLVGQEQRTVTLDDTTAWSSFDGRLGTGLRQGGASSSPPGSSALSGPHPSSALVVREALLDLLQSRLHADCDRLNADEAEMPFVGPEPHMKV